MVFLLLYVDDFLVFCKDLSVLQATKAALMRLYKMKDLGEAHLFIGFEITRDWNLGTISIAQSRFTTDLLAKYNMESCIPRDTPLTPGTTLVKSTTPDLSLPMPELVGSLNYLSMCTRPDIAQAVNMVSRHAASPDASHWNSAKSILRYLANNIAMGITYSRGSLTALPPILGFCDADFAADIDTRRSTTGYVFTLSNGAISWKSRLQDTVANSTTAAEYVAAMEAATHALWLYNLEHCISGSGRPTTIMGDNQAALATWLKPGHMFSKLKHLDVKYHFLKEQAAACKISLDWTPSKRNPADMLTKPLSKPLLLACLASIQCS
jgi:hypothetical protein